MLTVITAMLSSCITMVIVHATLNPKLNAITVIVIIFTVIMIIITTIMVSFFFVIFVFFFFRFGCFC